MKTLSRLAVCIECLLLFVFITYSHHLIIVDHTTAVVEEVVHLHQLLDEGLLILIGQFLLLNNN